MAKLGENNQTFQIEALSQIQQALSDLSLTLPKLEDHLSPSEKIELCVSDVRKTVDAINALKRYVDSALSSEGRTSLEDSNLGKYSLGKDLIKRLKQYCDITTCEKLSEIDFFDLFKGIAPLTTREAGQVNKFLVSRGYASLATKLDNNDRANFENSYIKPEDAIPKAIDSFKSPKRLSLKSLIYAEINTYGRLCHCQPTDEALDYVTETFIRVEHLRYHGPQRHNRGVNTVAVEQVFFLQNLFESGLWQDLLPRQTQTLQQLLLEDFSTIWHSRSRYNLLARR